MKKIFTVFALMMLFCATTSLAQRKWVLSENSVSEILSGDEHAYVLRQGVHPQWSSNGYLNSGAEAAVHTVDSTCFYSFIEYDEKVVEGETYKVYVMKNQANGKYVSNSGELYVDSRANAFKFTARKAVEMDVNAVDLTVWEVFSHCVNAARCQGAEEGGAWVLCNAESDTRHFLGFGDNPGFAPYVDTNHWFIHTATEVEITPYEKMTIIFEKYFTKGFDEELYPVGKQPGCVSQELFDAMQAAYNEGLAGTQNPDLDPAECDRIRLAIINVFDRYQKEMFPVGNGYYVIVNGRSMDATYDGGDIARCHLGMAAPEKWTPENSKYIWQVIEAEEEGKVYFKNWGTGRYLGVGDPYPMVADSTKAHAFTTPQFKGVWFRMFDGSWYVHNNGSAKLVPWNSTGTANWWRFDPIPVDTIEALAPEVEKAQQNRALSTLVNEVIATIDGMKTKSGITFDGRYLPTGKGLVTKVESNSSWNNPSTMFDGNVNTYFHTQWVADKAPADDWHWVQMDLGSEMSEIYLKFSDRRDRRDNRPTVISFVAPADGDVEAPQWTDTLFTGKVEATYATSFAGGSVDSTTFIGKIPFSKSVQHVRMVVLETVMNHVRGMGPTWNISELRVYNAAECVDNPRFTMIPQEIRDNLTAIINKANEELAAKEGTVETYEQLKAAYEKFLDAYPDPSELKSVLDRAEVMYQHAAEGDELGYFETGAKDEFLSVIESVKANMEKDLTLEEIATNKEQLLAAMKAFNSKLHTPVAGKVYRLVSAAPAEDANGKEPVMYSSLIVSANANINGTPVWRYKEYEGVDDRFNALWLLEKGEEGFTFKNLANGYYIGNPYEGLTEEELEELDFDEVGWSETPKHFEFGAGFEPGTFNIAMKDGQYLNCQPTGDLVHWHNGMGYGSAFQIQEVTADEFTATYKIDAKPGQIQVMSMPIDLGYVYSNSYAAMKVLGVKDGKVQLEEYAEDEIIPAGTPFIIGTDPANEAEELAAENFVLADLPTEDLESKINMTYNYKPVVQNGLVSTMVPFVIEPGYGIIYKSKVMVTEGGEQIYPNTGFFNNELPTTDVDGSLTLEMSGDISGEGTAVENVEIVKNTASDVYSVSGVKVRSNVKASVATKDLPKGVYIVNGKKVIVK